jgi:hypothetical protein
VQLSRFARPAPYWFVASSARALGERFAKCPRKRWKGTPWSKGGSGVWGDVFFLDQLGFKIYHNLPLSICWCENQGRVNWPIGKTSNIRGCPQWVMIVLFESLVTHWWYIGLA